MITPQPSGLTATLALTVGIFAQLALLPLPGHAQGVDEHTQQPTIGVQTAPASNAAPAVTQTRRTKPVHDGATVFERVSRGEMTRLQVLSGRIRNINYKPEEIEITREDATGQAIMSPLVDKTISLFVTTNTGATFTLIMQPVPGLPAGNIAVTEAAPTPHPKEAPPAKPIPTPLSMMSFEQAITTLVYIAANNQTLQGVSEEPINTSIPLWQGTEFVHLRNLNAAGMVLAEFRLTNTSKTTMRLTEQELYKPGVLAIAVEQHQLEGGESTPVFVVMEQKGDR